jgi:hypothetical protein
MQLGGDLKNAWIMFDHFKCIEGALCIGCHIYDLMYCKILTIYFCNIHSKSTEAQCVLWRKINTLMLKHDLSTTNFKGFMANGAHVNWDVIIIIYGLGNPTMCMDRKERIYLFWIGLYPLVNMPSS